MLKIREYRESKGISRIQLSRLSGVPLRTLEDWEAGKRRSPNVFEIAKVAKALDCLIEDLICLDDEE